MSATPPPNVEPFRINEQDEADAELGRRLRASKLAKLHEVATTGDDEEANRRRFADEAAQQALLLAGLGESAETSPRTRAKAAAAPAAPTLWKEHPPVVGVIVNRVASARMVFDRLAANPDRADAILLTG